MEEKRWEYDINIVFRNQRIVKLTITDHYQQRHPDISNELILLIVNLLNEKKLEPRKKHKDRDIYVWDRIFHEGKYYRLIFWFDNNETNHLWIKNCYRINY